MIFLILFQSKFIFFKKNSPSLYVYICIIVRDVLGVIFAYRRRTLADPGADEGESDLGDEVLFSPMREPGNDLVTSALLDILHVSGTMILPVRERRSRRPRVSNFYSSVR
jgi:hypothetical protein